jgi:hypothetical protein
MASERHKPSRSEWREFFDIVSRDEANSIVTLHPWPEQPPPD